MAKKKFLNLDNMNILWENIDRNFLRKEDIPYVEFGTLETNNKTILDAINELYRLINGNDNEVKVTCKPTLWNPAADTNLSSTVDVTYENYTLINEPNITSGSNWLSIYNSSDSGSTRQYTLSVDTNTGGSRSGSIVFSCANGSKQATQTFRITQAKGPAATINTNNVPESFDYNGVTDTEFDVTYANIISVNNPISSTAWLSVQNISSNGDVRRYKINVTKNTTSLERTGTITFTCLGKNGDMVSKSVTIRQSAANAATINFNPSAINVNWDATSANINVTYSNYNTVLTPTESLEWVTSINQKYSSGDLYNYTINFNQNDTTSSRSGNLIFKCKDLTGKEFTKNITITQSGKEATVSPMYWGHISSEVMLEYNINSDNGFFNNLTQECIEAAVEEGTLNVVNNPNSMINNITSYGVITAPVCGVILLPADSNLKAKSWNSLTQDSNFVDVTSSGRTDTFSNGEKTLTINGINYELYAELITSNLNDITDKMYFVVRNK